MTIKNAVNTFSWIMNKITNKINRKLKGWEKAFFDVTGMQDLFLMCEKFK